MAKSDIGKDGKISRRTKNDIYFKTFSSKIESEVYGRNRDREKKDGIKDKVLKLYHEKGWIAAYSILRKYPKFGIPDHTAREVLEMWIAEENAINKGREKDDDDAR